MNFNKLLIGLALLIGAFLIYKIRKWDHSKGNDYVIVNKLRTVKTWMMIAMCTIAGIVFIIEAL